MGFGAITDIRLAFLSEPHAGALPAAPLLPVALLAVAGDEARAERLQEAGANLIALGGDGNVPSVGALVNAAHSDLAETYIMVADGPRLNLALPQVKRLLGDRVEVLAASGPAEQEAVLRLFDPKQSLAENVARMRRQVPAEQIVAREAVISRQGRARRK